MELIGRIISPGAAEGPALITKDPVSFYGGVDPTTGIITDKDHELFGTSITGTIFIFPRGKGSTVGSYVLYRMKKQGTSPAGIINLESEAIIAVGAIIASIPLVDQLDKNPLEVIQAGQLVKIKGDRVIIN